MAPVPSKGEPEDPGVPGETVILLPGLVGFGVTGDKIIPPT